MGKKQGHGIVDKILVIRKVHTAEVIISFQK